MKVKRDSSLLLVIDIQQRLADTMVDKRRLIENTKTLAKIARLFGLPTLVTEQDKLGPTMPELSDALADYPKIRKLEFSCCQNGEFMNRLREFGRKSVVVCGIEAHICILQTVLDLVEEGYNVQVVQDAVSSYSVNDRDVAIERMRDSGAVITTTEALVYELMEKAGTEEFRRTLEIVRERRHSPTK